jgi:hypothetical protein
LKEGFDCLFACFVIFQKVYRSSDGTIEGVFAIKEAENLGCHGGGMAKLAGLVRTGLIEDFHEWVA